MKRVAYIVLSFWFLSIGRPGIAQEGTEVFTPDKDFEIWTSVGLGKSFLKKFVAEFEGEYRLNENVTRSKAIMGNIGIQYNMKKWIRFKINYRFTNRIEFLEHRLNGDINLRYELARFRITFRTRAQREWVVNRLPKDHVRERVKVEYNIRKFPVDPYVTCEGWYRFSYKGNQFEEFRGDIGLQWSINKKNELVVFYKHLRELNINDPQYSYILGIGYSYEFD